MYTKSKKLNLIFLIFFIFFASFEFYSQESTKTVNVYFYGVIVPESQINQKNITQDLFAAQIRILQNVNFIDKRNFGLSENFFELSDDQMKEISTSDKLIFNLIPDLNSVEESIKNQQSSNKIDIIFFAKIDKLEDESWICSFYSKNLQTQKYNFQQQNFLSYYKLLADAKSQIEQILGTVSGTNLKTIQNASKIKSASTNNSNMTIENVSGTWSGENGITKIILMRSGRGFVIFSNGASMTINVSVINDENQNKVLKVIQNANFNASFYPNIPRQKVLSFAGNAKPIEWKFSLTENGELEGTKTTLGLDSSENIIEERLKVVWKKQS